MARQQRASEERARGFLEITTAILLGLVSVATAFGAYQASQWAQLSSDLAGASQQARDRNLTIFLENEIIAGDDFQRLFDVIGLNAQATFYPERRETVEAEQDVIIGAASAPLAEAFPGWREKGYPFDEIPVLVPAYQALTYAPAQSYNVVSKVADVAADAYEDRSYTMTIVSVVFAFALLMLGVSGASGRLQVSAIMTGAGAVTFLIGVAVVIFGIY
jgi:hypothetical protein